MPDSVPENSQLCRDANPDKRPGASLLLREENKYKHYYYNDIWDTIYHNDIRPLTRLGKESKYSSKLLPTGDLLKPGNSYDLGSAADMETRIDCVDTTKSIYNINMFIVL